MLIQYNLTLLVVFLALCFNHQASTNITVDIMEALLSLAFDNISSKDGLKIRKGIRQIEGLLAQICLPNPSSSRALQKRRASAIQLQGDATTPKSLQQVAEDPAFREFFRLQENFGWNGKCPSLLVPYGGAVTNKRRRSIVTAHRMSQRDSSGYAEW